MNRLHSVSLVTSFLVISAIAFVLVPSNGLAARTCIWDGGGGDNLASTAANWDGPDTAPIAGDSIQFDATSTKACTWDITASLASFSINSGYTGTITQACNMLLTDFTQTAGTFTASQSYTISIIGSWIKTGGTTTPAVVRLIMNGDGETLTMDSSSNEKTFWDLTINGNTNYDGNTHINSGLIARNFIIASGKTLAISSGEMMEWINHIGGTLNNDGVINGLGAFRHRLYSTDYTDTGGYGQIDAPVSIYLDGSTSSNRAITLGADYSFGSSLTLTGLASKTLTVNLNNHDLSCSGICTISTNATLTGTGNLTIGNNLLTGTSAVLTQGGSITINGNLVMGSSTLNGQNSGQFELSGSWDGYNGTFVSGTSTITFTGASKTIYANTNRFWNVVNTAGASTTMQTDVYVAGYFWNNGTFSKGGHTLYLNHDQAPVFSSTPVFSCRYDQAYSYDANASDQENITDITYSLVTDHPTATINSTTGVVSTPGNFGNGSYTFRITASDGNNTSIQEYIVSTSDYVSTYSMISLGLGLLFCFGFLFLGLKWPVFLVIDGIIWIIVALSIFFPYGTLFWLVGLGFGIILFLEGGVKLAR